MFWAGLLRFAVQPLIAKFVVPRFGGGSDVWTTCMLFFQAMLLCGYAYGHLSVSLLSRRGQAVLHVAVLLVAALSLPIRAWVVGAEGRYPVAAVLGTLAVSIGVPYYALASSSPLLQRWVAGTRGQPRPYRLYALSNAGSLLAVIGYPFLAEPWLSRQAQAQAWSWGMGALVALQGCLALGLLRRGPVAQARGQDAAEADRPAPAPRVADGLLWVALSAGASVVLLAATNKICQDVAAIPLLWMVPLCVYLLSFVICFHSERTYVRPVWLAALMATLIAAVIVDSRRGTLPVLVQIGAYLAALAACCMVCHGELYRLRPGPRFLTRYYLSIASGGCCGGLLVAVVAPVVLRSYLELFLGLAACCVFALLAEKNPSPRLRRRRWAYAVVIAFISILAAVMERGGAANERLVASRRNFYGVVSVWEQDADDPAHQEMALIHGTTIHGLQFVQGDKHRLPTAYYGHRSGVGLAIEQLPSAPRRIGVVGLGVGTIAAYGREGDTIRFYEINPAVRDMARTYFTYLADCPAAKDVVMGDARLSLERQEDQQFDLLVLDAFSGDSVPLHLLTAEAFQTYLRHLKAAGILAVHSSGQYLDIRPVVMKLSGHLGLAGVCVYDEGDKTAGTLPSTWVLLSSDGRILDAPGIRRAADPPLVGLERIGVWTDDYVNPLQLLRWKPGAAVGL
ncbi:MAG: fused MFS/spermidine synthase [Phycisphaerae bacterium]|nr:fused MFS/spermidine synthase [Phycisphaerae bacterium]